MAQTPGSHDNDMVTELTNATRRLHLEDVTPLLRESEVDLFERVGHKIRSALSGTIDRETGVIYIAQAHRVPPGIGTGTRGSTNGLRPYIKVGFSKQRDGSRVQAIVDKCRHEIRHAMETPLFQNAHRGEKIMLEWLGLHPRPPFLCACGSKHTEWFDRDLETVKMMTLMVYTWMAKLPYTNDGELKPEWSTALEKWSTSLRSRSPMSLEQFFLHNIDTSVLCNNIFDHALHSPWYDGPQGTPKKVKKRIVVSFPPAETPMPRTHMQIVTGSSSSLSTSTQLESASQDSHEMSRKDEDVNRLHKRCRHGLSTLLRKEVTPPEDAIEDGNGHEVLHAADNHTRLGHENAEVHPEAESEADESEYFSASDMSSEWVTDDEDDDDDTESSISSEELKWLAEDALKDGWIDETHLVFTGLMGLLLPKEDAVNMVISRRNTSDFAAKFDGRGNNDSFFTDRFGRGDEVVDDESDEKDGKKGVIVDQDQEGTQHQKGAVPSNNQQQGDDGIPKGTSNNEEVGLHTFGTSTFHDTGETTKSQLTFTSQAQSSLHTPSGINQSAFSFRCQPLKHVTTSESIKVRPFSTGGASQTNTMFTFSFGQG